MESAHVCDSATGQEDGDHGPPAPGAAEDIIVLPWNDIDVLTNALDRHRDQVAAIITEPVMCNTNCIMPRSGYLEEMRRLCDERGIVLIFDEVITGFRLALGGAQEFFGVTPDDIALPHHDFRALVQTGQLNADTASTSLLAAVNNDVSSGDYHFRARH